MHLAGDMKKKAQGLPDPQQPKGTEGKPQLPGTPGMQPAQSSESRKPAEDSLFKERDRELHDEKNPRSHHAPRATEQ